MNMRDSFFLTETNAPTIEVPQRRVTHEESDSTSNKLEFAPQEVRKCSAIEVVDVDNLDEVLAVEER